jgi:uncharacterized protein involved in type VI secretion and phage assembly
MRASTRALDLDEKYYGVVIGIVEKLEGDPDKEGRIKVSYPWFDGNGTPSEWARVCAVYGGNGFGTFFIPEEKTEVLIGFIHGDMRAPIILGNLYNGKDKPPSHRTKERNEKLVRTKGGHEVLLDDSDGKLKVRIKTAGNQVVELDDQNKKLTVKTAGNNSAVFDDNANKVTVTTASGDSATFDGSAKKITLQTSTVEINASSVKLGIGASQSVILGETFVGLFNSHTHNLGPAQTSPPVPPLIPQAVLSFTTKTS